MDLAKILDAKDDLAHLRARFCMPKKSNGDTCIYLCGNSLGPMPADVNDYMSKELNAWANLAVTAHFDKENDYDVVWKNFDEPLYEPMAKIAGAKPSEIAITGSLTSNMNNLLLAFYQPTEKRFKILIEKKAFPSDQYAVKEFLRLKNLNVEESLIEISPRAGEYSLSTEDVVDTIKSNSNEIALVLLPGIQYFTGQLFDIKTITSEAHKVGCMIGWDLAHAIGNVELQLHDWDVDFAVWCSYKYLNAGPGAIGGMFVHEKYADDHRPRSAGWWGHNKSTRFDMPDEFDPIPGARGYVQSNPSIMSLVPLHASLQIFKAAGYMTPLRNKSVGLVKFLEALLKQSPYYTQNVSQPDEKVTFTIITSPNEQERGSQLSLKLLTKDEQLIDELNTLLYQNSVVCDCRRPGVIRVSPCPLYVTYTDVARFIDIFNYSFKKLIQTKV